MARTYAQLQTVIAQILQDTGLATWTAAELDVHTPDVLTEISMAMPYRTRLTLYTVADKKDITLTAGDKHRLLKIDRGEYPVDQDPPNYRNVKRWGDVITLNIDSAPSADGESVYLYVNQKQRLQKEVGTTDLAGAVKTGAAAGVTSLALKSLGTGTINKDTKLEIAGDTTDYIVIDDTTIAGSEASVSIYPKLAAAVLADAVVTLTLSESTLDDKAETAFCHYVAGAAAISKAQDKINKVNIGGGAIDAKLRDWGMEQISFAMSILKSEPSQIKQSYPSS
jgi:hypothetical protein